MMTSVSPNSRHGESRSWNVAAVTPTPLPIMTADALQYHAHKAIVSSLR